MTISTYLRWESEDASAYWNYRNAGLRTRGILDGTGTVSAVSGQLKVEIDEFKAQSYDGMTIVSTAAEQLTLTADETFYIVCYAKYNLYVAPTLSLQAMTSSTYTTHPEQDYLIVFTKITVPPGATDLSGATWDGSVRDVIDSLKRFAWREPVANFAALPTDSHDVKDGDIRIALDTYTIYIYNDGLGDWQNLTVEWPQFITNGSFDLANDADTIDSTNSLVPFWSSRDITDGNPFTWTISHAGPYSGGNELQVVGGAITGQAWLWHNRILKVDPSAGIRINFWMRGASVAPIGGSGNQGVRVDYYNNDFTYLSSAYVANNTLNGTFAYTEVEDTLTAPASAYWARIGIGLNTDGILWTGTLFFDHLRVYIQAGSQTYAQDDVMAKSLGITPDTSQYTDQDEYVRRTLELAYDQYASSVHEYKWKHKSSLALNWLLKLIGGSLNVNRAVEVGESLLGTVGNAALPRISGDAGTVADYVLITEFGQHTGSKGRTRLYHARDCDLGLGGGEGEALVLTVNAEWADSGGTNQWTVDNTVTTVDSMALVLSVDSLRIYKHDQDANTTWTSAEWDTDDFGKLFSAGESSIDIPKIITSLGNDSLVDATANAAARISGSVGTAADYLHIFEFGSFRLYYALNFDLGTGGSGGKALVITVNAEWVESAGTNLWVASGSSTDDSYALVVSQSLFFLYKHDHSVSSIWTSNAWDTEEFGDLLSLDENGLALPKKIIDLGNDLIGSQDNAVLPRISGDTGDGTLADYVLIAEFGSSGYSYSRLYHANNFLIDGTNQEALVLTMNAEYFDDTGVWKWQADDNSVNATAIALAQGAIHFFVHDSNTTDPWLNTEWISTTYGRMLQIVSTGIYVPKRIRNLGNDLVGSQDDAVLPRISGDTGATADYVLVSEFGSGSEGYSRVYHANNWGIVAPLTQPSLMLTMNAEYYDSGGSVWKWRADDTTLGLRSTAIALTEDGISFFVRSAALSPWDTDEWESVGSGRRALINDDGVIADNTLKAFGKITTNPLASYSLYNVSGVAYAGTTGVTITFDTAFSDANYIVNATIGSSFARYITISDNISFTDSTKVTIYVWDDPASPVDITAEAVTLYFSVLDI